MVLYEPVVNNIKEKKLKDYKNLIAFLMANDLPNQERKQLKIRNATN